MRYYFSSEKITMWLWPFMLSSWKLFIQDRRKVKLEESISEERRAKRPKEPIHDEPVYVFPPPPHTYSRISHPLERYLGMLNRGCREKLFLMKDKKYRDDPKTYNEVMLDIDSKKGCEIAFLTGYLLKIFIWSNL